MPWNAQWWNRPRRAATPFAPGTPKDRQEPPLTWQFRPPLGKVRRAPAAGAILGAFADPTRQSPPSVTRRPGPTSNPYEGLPPDVLRKLLIP